MLYQTVIFQLISNDIKYLGLLCYDEVNTSLQDLTFKNIIYNKITKFNNDIINNESYDINVITKYYDKPSVMDNIIYDIVINNKDNKIFINNIEYNDIITESNTDIFTVWNGNIYDDDELEYVLPENNAMQTYTIPYYDYLDKEHENYDLKNIFDIKNVQGYNDFTDYQKEEAEERIKQNIQYRDLLKDFDNKSCFQTDFINAKLEDTDKKLNSLENIFNESYDLKLTYGSLLCRKYKYMNNNLKYIKYNFIVTDINETTDDHDTTEIIISIKSFDSNFEGYYNRLKSSYGECYNLSMHIDEDANIEKYYVEGLLTYLYEYLFC